LKVRVKHVLAIVVLIPLSILALSAWLYGGDSVAKLFTLFPLLLVSVLFVKPLNKPSVLRFRVLANLLGAILPLASLFLPYSFLGGDPWYPLGPGAISSGVPQLIMLGCLLTFFSRFGGIVTVAGLLDWSSTRPIFFCSANGCPPYILGPGYWLAWAGALVSLLGRSFVVTLPRSVEGRKLLGSIMFPVGLIVAISGVLLPFASYTNFGPEVVLSPVFFVTGFLLSGVGLNLFFRLESTTISRIRRALQKPVW
jgi:hypothetical protein